MLLSPRFWTIHQFHRGEIQTHELWFFLLF